MQSYRNMALILVASAAAAAESAVAADGEVIVEQHSPIHEAYLGLKDRLFAGDEVEVVVRPIATSWASVREKCDIYELYHVEDGDYCSSKKLVEKSRDLVSKPMLSMLREPEQVEPKHDMLSKVS